MSGFFERILGRGKDQSSAGKAKERLQFVLVHDRINLPPERMKSMKEEILAVISKYVSVYGDEVEIALEQRDRNNNRLIAEIPFAKTLEGPEKEPPDEGLSPALQAEIEASRVVGSASSATSTGSESSPILKPDDTPGKDASSSGEANKPTT